MAAFEADFNDEASAEAQPVSTSNMYRRSRSKFGVGIRFLRQQARDEEGLSDAARNYLQTLLEEHDIDIDEDDNDDDDGSDEPPPHKKLKTMPLQTVDTTMSDESILQMARQEPSPMSLLASLLKVLEDGERVVSARAFLKTCALTVRPGWVPPKMDAKEMVLAGLQFLCRTRPDCLRAVQTPNDLEKRSYEKVGSWKLAEMLDSIKELEEAFYRGDEKLGWMPRTRFVPRVSNTVEEDLLLLKGDAPAGSNRKKVVRKKKVVKKAAELEIGGSESP